jgi:signal transduction histidine kinase
MKRPLSKAKRLYVKIVIIFVLLIIIPSIILSYLSITTIRGEAEVYDRDRRAYAHSVGTSFTSSVLEDIRKTESEVNEKAAMFFAGRFELSIEEYFSLLEERIPLVKRILVTGTGGKVLYPPWKAPYILPEAEDLGGFAIEPPGRKDDSNWKDTRKLIEARRRLDDKLGKAGILEMGDHDYAGALRLYREIASSTPPEYAAAGRNGMARCFRSLGHLENASATWMELMEEAPAVRLPSVFGDYNELPVVLVAYREAGACLRQTGKYAAAADVYLSFYSGLLSGKYRLTRQEYNRARGNVNELLAELDETSGIGGAQKMRLDALRTEEKRINEETAFHEFLHGPFAKVGPWAGESRYFHRQTDEGVETISFRRIKRKDGRRVIVGFVLDTAYLREHVVPGRLAGLAGKDLRVALVVPGRGAPRGKSARDEKDDLSVKVSFNEHILPGWKALVEHTDVERTRARGRRLLYLYLAIIVVLVLAICAGIMYSLKNISKEIELSKLKSDFVANVSHELKTPLTSIRMFSEMLRLDRVPSEEKRREYYNIISSESERLTKLINNMLDFSRIEEGRKEFNFALVNPAEVVESAAGMFRYYAESRGFKLKTRIDPDMPPIWADADAIGQVVINLLSNAVKYSGESRKITLSAFTGSEGNIGIRVRDKGVGIKESDLPHVFDKFFRVGDHLTSEVSGSGLGLTLVHEIVKAHNGDVGVRSTPGKGSAFTIYLPIHKEA